MRDMRRYGSGLHLSPRNLCWPNAGSRIYAAGIRYAGEIPACAIRGLHLPRALESSHSNVPGIQCIVNIIYTGLGYNGGMYELLK
jgi:hypothetical protein